MNNSLGYGEPCSLVVEPEPGYLLTLSDQQIYDMVLQVVSGHLDKQALSQFLAAAVVNFPHS